MEQKIRALIKQAMIEKNTNKLVTYKSILEKAQKIAKNQGANVEVTDDMIIKAVQNEIKQLNELKQYCKDGDERLQEINDKLEYCNNVLPEMISCDEAIQYLDANKIEKNIGTCIKALKAEFGSKIDGKTASDAAKAFIKA